MSGLSTSLPMASSVQPPPTNPSKNGLFNEEVQGNIIAIGDIHGDWEAFKMALVDCAQVARIPNPHSIDLSRSLHWIGKNTYVIFLGDIVDRRRKGPNSDSLLTDGKTVGEFDGEELLILQTINFLDSQAKLQHGRVLKLFGNHEQFNLDGYYRQETDSFCFDSPFAQSRKNGLWMEQTFRPALLSWSNTFLMVKIKDWVFVHGSIELQLLKILLEDNASPIVAINQIFKARFEHPTKENIFKFNDLEYKKNIDYYSTQIIFNLFKNFNKEK